MDARFFSDIVRKLPDNEVTIETDATLEGIGQLLNGRDHSTILHGRNVIEEEYNNDEEFRKQIDTIKKKINPN